MDPRTETTPAPRQTLSYLRGLLDERGIRPKAKLGQNFLIDLNLLDVLVSAAELQPDDFILEVGSGTGTLTARLCEAAGAVLSVELDPSFHELVRELLYGRTNLRLLHHDILKNKNEIRPVIFEEADLLRQKHNAARVKLVANLPYAVAVPVISNLLLKVDWPLERMVVMVQYEIAERLMAAPGTKDYGALAILVQSLTEVIPVRRRLPPTVFWPRPLVASSIIMIRPDLARRAEVVRIVGSVQRFRDFLRDLYTHRRKNLRGALSACPSGRREKADVDRILENMGLLGTVRAEDLTVEEHLELCAAFVPQE